VAPVVVHRYLVIDLDQGRKSYGSRHFDLCQSQSKKRVKDGFNFSVVLSWLNSVVRCGSLSHCYFGAKKIRVKKISQFLIPLVEMLLLIGWNFSQEENLKQPKTERDFFPGFSDWHITKTGRQ
jgi:hypothetical protein